MRIILILDWAYVNGGQAKVAIDSAIGLKALGHEPILFAASGPVEPSLIEAGVEVHCLGQNELVKDGARLAAIWRGIHNGQAAERLNALLALQPHGDTIVHVHGWAKALSSSIATPIRASGLPTVYTMHDYYLLCPNGGFYNYHSHEQCRLTPFSPSCLATHCDTRTYAAKGWRVGRSLVMKHVHRMPDIATDIICFHAFQRSNFERHLRPGVRLHEVANPIEVARLPPKDDPTSGEFIFLGRISQEKGCFLYAEAMTRAGLVPVFVGDGPLAGEVAKRYPNARLLGWHEGEAVRRRLREARAMVFPSLVFEGQPLAVLESLSLGTPVISGNGNAGRESIVDGETGLTFQQADVESLVAAIRRMQDDALITRMSHAAHQRYWAAPFTIERHCQRLIEVYERVIAR
jgi:glycosyltransferase involved in cell wall biosynthesis